MLESKIEFLTEMCGKMSSNITFRMNYVKRGLGQHLHELIFEKVIDSVWFIESNPNFIQISIFRFLFSERLKNHPIYDPVEQYSLFAVRAWNS